MQSHVKASLDSFLFDSPTIVRPQSNATSFLPKKVRHVRIPPVKCQGIKSKLVPFILSNIKWDGNGTWCEPFMGSGVVGFNARPKKAIFSDTNPHIITMYQQIQSKTIDPRRVQKFLQLHGKKLARYGDSTESYYYEMRDQFNQNHDPLYFIFLNRACFNGLMRFNSKGAFNSAFGRKPDRFSSAYITKICNQIKWLQELISNTHIEFRCCSWKKTIDDRAKNDFVYLDPPYFGRNATYYDEWTEHDLNELAEWSHTSQCGWAISLWYENECRKNTFIDDQWKNDIVRLFKHQYFIGSTEELRKNMVEALIIKNHFAAQKEKN